ncbi:MAG: deoxyribonuclease V [Acidobacteriota bacterium]
MQIQKRLREEIRLGELKRDVRTIGGADISFNRFSKVVYAGIVVLRLPDLELIDSVAIRTTVNFPYIPGLLSFRETPPLLEAWGELNHRPDLLMLDGHGIAHPRRFGIASHLGLLLDLPTIGCAKSLLIGHFEEPGAEPGSHSPLLHCPAGAPTEEIIGAVLRTRRNIAPVFISPGHLIDLPTAIRLVQQTTTRYRQPEPTRQAHLLVNRSRRSDLSTSPSSG